MKINSEMTSVINLIKKDEEYQKRSGQSQGNTAVADKVTIENKAASRSPVETVDEARVLLSDVMKGMANTSSSVHNLNQDRISQLVS